MSVHNIHSQINLPGAAEAEAPDPWVGAGLWPVALRTAVDSEASPVHA